MLVSAYHLLLCCQRRCCSTSSIITKALPVSQHGKRAQLSQGCLSMTEPSLSDAHRPHAVLNLRPSALQFNPLKLQSAALSKRVLMHLPVSEKWLIATTSIKVYKQRIYNQPDFLGKIREVRPRPRLSLILFKDLLGETPSLLNGRDSMKHFNRHLQSSIPPSFLEGQWVGVYL